MSEKIIEIKQLDFAYHQALVLEKINLVVHKGDFLGLIGPNGAGKSTLLKIMLGLLPMAKNQGEVFLFGQEITKFKHWQKIGYVAQRAGFNSSGFPISVEEVIKMAGGKNEEIERVLKLVDLADKKQVLLRELSGGQQQRVFIARALLHQPELLILDEPTVGIDRKSQKEFYALLHRLNREEELTLILVSHETEVVAKEASAVACINKSLNYHAEPEGLHAHQH